ncbi:MAG: ADP-glyceromanno-heptose 6-epimerase [Planctomycetes bacterium]|nr:ADP-glyceromanno-heptose 6-epimerase [Planctomycetota bacterium]
MIAVTGSAGFIGSNLAHRLARDGQALLLVDRNFTPEKSPNIAGLTGHPSMKHDEFLDALATDRVSPEAIFHLGACSSTTEKNWDFLVEINIGYSQKIWNWCASRGRPMIYASSAATYGDGTRGFDDRTPPGKLLPLNLYGKSKNDFDQWALEMAATREAAPPKWAGLKFFNVYGPRERHKGRMASVVWHARKQILETGEMKLFRSNDPAIADGVQRRDFVFVDDCVEHMLWLWKRPAPNAIYNSGTGSARTFLDLTRAVFAGMQREPRIAFIDMPPDVAGQYQNYTQADMSRLIATGYDHPVTVLETGVAKTVQSMEDAQ